MQLKVKDAGTKWLSAYGLGKILLGQVFSIYLTVSLCFLFRISIGWICFPLGLLVGWGIGWPGNSSIKSIGNGLTSILCWVVSILIGSIITDCSFDGIVYHQEIIAAICRGWTPGGVELADAPLSIWALHYAKGLEMIQAAIVSFVGTLESGKGVNFILGLTAFLFVYSFSRQHFPRTSKPLAVGVGIVAVCNPVYVCQSITYYIDFAKYIYTLLAIIFLFGIGENPRKKINYALLGMVILLAIATKFNAFFEAGVTVFAAVIWWVVRHQYKLAISVGLFALIIATIGACVLNYHPYVTNFLDKGHPLYPLLGEGSVDIMTGLTPAELLGENRFYSFFYSLFSPAIPGIESRTGGFGPLMPLLILLSLVEVWYSRKIGSGVGIYISVWVIASCFFFEQSWWARYICQLWILIVIGGILAASCYRQNKWQKIVMWIMVAGSVLVAGRGLTRVLKKSHERTEFTSAIYSVFKGQEVKVSMINEAYLRQFSERGITLFLKPDSISSEKEIMYFGPSSEPNEYPMIYLDASQYNRILEKIRE